MRKLLVSGGQGFIGSNFLKHLIKKYPKDKIVNVDAFTYAARPSLLDVEETPHVSTVKVNLQDQLAVKRLLEKEQPDHIFHLAAESHVCRSISGPKDFVMTNIVGTWNLIEEAKSVWANAKNNRFVHISTDEVFGQLTRKDKPFTEKTPVAPRSPYSASKASADHLVQAYHETYGLNTVITNCSNNYGVNQHAEKLIPKTICRIFQRQAVDVFQTGKQVRDWLYVDDHCQALITAFEKAVPGERYCIGGDKELENIQLVEMIYDIIHDLFPKDGYVLKIDYKDSRPTDDMRYAIDNRKIKRLGWSPDTKHFKQNLQYTILWYWGKLISGGSVKTKEGGFTE